MIKIRPVAAPSLLRFIKLEQVCTRPCHHAVAPNEYTDVPKYPPIVDMSRRAKKKRLKTAWHDKITKLPTVEQKLMELNLPKYYGYWSGHLIDVCPKLLGLNFIQYATRTHVVNGLPEEYYSDVKNEAERLTTAVTDKVEHLIHLNYNCPLSRRSFGPGRASERHSTQNFLLGLHRLMASTVDSTVQHIKESVVDMQPRVEAFWILGGLPPDEMLRKTRKNYEPSKELENDLIDRTMQGVSTPRLGVRVTDGLPEVVSRDDPLATSAFVPDNKLDPRAFGFWPGEKKEHSQLWLHSREFITKFVEEYVTELTYPLVQQSAITDGQRWNFSVYQLNTCTLHSDLATNNPHNNILWLGEEQVLFENGVKGLNAEVLTALISMYLKKGIERDNPTPHLGSYKHLADHPASEEYREMFQSHLHDLFSGRGRHFMKPEMYLWEKIYKKDFNTRFFEARRRFFENHYKQKDPGQRRLDEYSPIYIPKAKRKDRRVKYKPMLDSEELYKYH
ncbi:28S ribosomal protein S30-like [Homarus americanus]|uniref:28S ribosomal protein S30-like n=1 Tax=Homarus americanus TaxID=6706 RepID=A0A8J5T709_HOMAM|nr:28S ribosomal protein S30-like [Homarus americanus]